MNHSGRQEHFLPNGHREGMSIANTDKTVFAVAFSTITPVSCIKQHPKTSMIGTHGKWPYQQKHCLPQQK